MSEVDNGVNVEHLLGAREVIDETPALGQFEFRARVGWASGMPNRGGCRSSTEPKY